MEQKVKQTCETGEHSAAPEAKIARHIPMAENILTFTENILTITCKLPSQRDPLKNGQNTVQVQLPSRCNVHQLRLGICIQVHNQNHFSDPLAVLDPEQYQLLYFKEGECYEIQDDHQVLQTLNIEWQLDSKGAKSTEIMLSPVPEVTEEQQNAHQLLAYLIGYDLNTAPPNRLGELNCARRKFAFPRKKELQRRDPQTYAMEPWTTSVPLLQDQQEFLAAGLPLTLHYCDLSFELMVDLNSSPDNLIEIFLEKISAFSRVSSYSTKDFTLQVSGREEFFIGNDPLSKYLWVRQCLKTMQVLHLLVLPISSFNEDKVRPEDFPLVDSFTGLPVSHDELAICNKEIADIMMISLRDCERKLRVKLLGLDIPKLPSKVPQQVHVQVSIIYGNKVVSSVCSSSKPLADEVLWNVWLEFDVLLNNLPRGAKLGFTVNVTPGNGSPVRENKPSILDAKMPLYQRDKGKVLFFANLLLIDHRSLLSQGMHTLYMWPFPEEDEAFTYEADKLSSATNPEQANSMAITFLLDRYSFPVVLPKSTASPPACSSYRTMTETKEVYPDTQPDESTVNTSQPADTSSPSLSPLQSLERAHLRRFREKSVHYGSNLPQFLQTINWFKPSTVQDIHLLLSHWDPKDLDVPIALELLSVDFADEQVRKLAVQKLEVLSNEEVVMYLIQLVQTLKVELYHDSYLARFLIQRALRSKRVGHYFFWYLRSEVSGCLYFQQRLAVILEAYLLGCGQAMLNSFKQQVQLVESLENVAVQIKTLFPEKSDLPPTAAQKLQEMLQECNLPKEFQVPFDPRLKAGAIMLDKCKVMASKKKPLWLEFSPPVSHRPSGPPVGIIFKHGDDLRQDMLVIQTLMVMDSIWQNKSMDLNLVPYGCISTGNNIGLIEIVRNSATIAAVQRSQGGSRGAFKNDALFEWLKSRSPVQEIQYQAMERFVTSCAGYCVATYVLGIGDRHNDNIMISDQGNLFHIDFGHIMGNTKRFLGVNRERVPFVLTPDFLYVMGRVEKKSALYFQRFQKICTEAYLSLRTHTRLLVTLFSLMLLTGIPELSSAQDMRYLREALQEDINEEQARNHFLQQIDVCEARGWTVQANWWIHMVAGIK